MEAVYGTPSDIDVWMNLVNDVSWNFPGLETQEKIEEHKETVLRFMSKKQALCMKDNDEIAGVILFSREHNMICCLAVSPRYRRRGIIWISKSKVCSLCGWYFLKVRIVPKKVRCMKNHLLLAMD